MIGRKLRTAVSLTGIGAPLGPSAPLSREAVVSRRVNHPDLVVETILWPTGGRSFRLTAGAEHVSLAPGELRRVGLACLALVDTV
jgi:hypothetical protein